MRAAWIVIAIFRLYWFPKEELCIKNIETKINEILIY